MRADGNLHRELRIDHVATRMSLFPGLLNYQIKYQNQPLINQPHTTKSQQQLLGNIRDNPIGLRLTHERICTVVSYRKKNLKRKAKEEEKQAVFPPFEMNS